MTKKLIRIEIYLLFFLTINSFIYFYFQESFPDSYLQISNSSNSNYLIYIFSSFVQFLNFYSGPWIFLPLLLLATTYFFKFSKRKNNLDSISIINFLVFFSLLNFLVAPTLLGNGIVFYIEKIGIFPVVLLTILFFNLTCYQIFEARYIKFVKFVAAGLSNLFTYMRVKLGKNLKSQAIIKGMLTKIINNLKNFKINFIRNTVNEASSEMQSDIRIEPTAMAAIRSNSTKQCEDNQLVELEDNFENEEVLEDNLDFELSDTTQDLEADELDTEIELVGPKVLMKKAKILDENRIQLNELISALSSKANNKINNQPEDQYFVEKIMTIQEKMKEFNINAKVTNILKGPVVDTYELELGSGVKVSRIENMHADLSLALKGETIRIVSQMKGKSTIGIEIPRNPRDIIYLDGILKDQSFVESKFNLPMAFGKTSLGDTAIYDLSSMPHMLVAGSTGTGKSVFLNTILVSLLVKLSPKNLKLILIDPKQLELAVYSSIPHLLIPVVTDPKSTSLALLWACEEMERRYSILKDFGVRNIAQFNTKIENASDDQLEKISKYYSESDEDYELPFIVIVVDEFADLMNTSLGKNIETNIARLAAKARASGIHIILATQRPSVDVITGTIKNNFPARVAFKVIGGVDSRTILGHQGAENLLGRGDMLLSLNSEMTRLHSAFVDIEEIEELTKKLSNLKSKFNEKAMEFIENGGLSELDEDQELTGIDMPREQDPKFKEAVRIVWENKDKGASASMLQRRLNIGYNKAANLIESMERQGIVGPQDGARPRKVLPLIENFIS